MRSRAALQHAEHRQLSLALSGTWCQVIAETSGLSPGLRTVQSWLGHRDIQSTMVYLKGVRAKDAAAKVNSGELATLVA